MQALLDGLDASAAVLTWLDRGLPSVPDEAEPGSNAFGFYTGRRVDDEQAQRPEL